MEIILMCVTSKTVCMHAVSFNRLPHTTNTNHKHIIACHFQHGLFNKLCLMNDGHSLETPATS